ncbi:hypothetical protein IEQ34_015742 [Dendrobium chrysotoxum]|uniref:Secreted protein n=1 Tax=Dendrobium chrysotoxum TaxID=161865 RepID=A0AAV7GHI4_DENCH|nr:hypothetical protein IEQ34_015742 [Dendrobium chrysotoxum]
MAYFWVQLRAVASYRSLSFLHMWAISGTSGSSGFGSVSTTKRFRQSSVIFPANFAAAHDAASPGSDSILTTSLIVGRASLFSCTHIIATPYSLAIFSTGAGDIRLSVTAIAASLSSPASATVFLTHRTMSTPSPNPPTGLLPVISSKRTTPKLYTSLFSSTLSVYAYSANKFFFVKFLARVIKQRSSLWRWDRSARPEQIRPKLEFVTGRSQRALILPEEK